MYKFVVQVSEVLVLSMSDIGMVPWLPCTIIMNKLQLEKHQSILDTGLVLILIDLCIRKPRWPLHGKCMA